MRRRKNQRAPPPRPGGGGAARGGGRPASPRTGLLEVAEDQVVQLLRTDRHRAARARPSPLGGEAGRVPVPLSLSQPPPSPPPGAVGGKGALRVPWSLEPPPARRGGAPPSPPAPPAPAGASRKVKAPLSRSGFDFFFVAFFLVLGFFCLVLGLVFEPSKIFRRTAPRCSRACRLLGSSSRARSRSFTAAANWLRDRRTRLRLT